MIKYLSVLLFSLFVVGLTPAVGQNNAKKKPASEGVSADISAFKPLSKMDSTVRGAIYADPSRPAADRAHDLIRRMTFEEKLNMTGGWNRFMVSPVPRLGVRPVSMADASQGIRLQTALVKEKSTSFPGMLPLASTWNPALAAEMGSCMAAECRAHGVDILLGPGINIQRLSVGGRNFEYMGEDPILTGAIATAYISNLQKGGVIATPKHFIGNDQDFCRHIANSVIDERTLREIYLLPWEQVITEGGSLGMMTGNNLVNGIPCSMHKPLIADILRAEYGFAGLAMTDWQNTGYYPARQLLVATSGETLLMPENTTFRKYVEQEIARSPERKAEMEALIERMIYPTLYALFEMGIYDREFSDPSLFARMDEHKAFAARCATEAMVLLKNEKGILPLKSGQKILLTGSDEIHSGTGSGFVTGYDHVSYEQGLKALYGDDLICEADPDDATVRKADVVLFRFNKAAGEGRDIPYEEPVAELQRLREVTKLNKNVVVLVNACNVFPMDWLKDVRGVVWCYFLGQERGTALARLLSGQENFSGKLPFTIERSFSESPAPEFNYIGGKPYWFGNNQYKGYWLGQKKDPVKGFSDYVKPGQTVDVPYEEGIFIGYRWYDKHQLPVVFPFGYGLSYTTFAYETISCDNRLASEGKVLVTVRVKNTGKQAGQEVVQLYVSDPQSSVERPVKELKAFQKVSLEPGQSQDVTLELTPRSFSFWDTASKGWKLESGEFVLQAGGSSADLPLQTVLNL